MSTTKYTATCAAVEFHSVKNSAGCSGTSLVSTVRSLAVVGRSQVLVPGMATAAAPESAWIVRPRTMIQNAPG